MKTIFYKILLLSLFVFFATSNLYAEDKTDNAKSALYTVTFNISGLPGTFHFTSPGSKTVIYDGSGTETVTVTGLHDAGTTGIVVTFVVFTEDPDAEMISIFSPNYRGSIYLNQNGTDISFIVPFNMPNVSMGLQ